MENNKRYNDAQSFEFIERLKINNKKTMPYPHYHNSHELYYLVRGSVNYLVGNKLYFLNSEDFIFIPKGVYHQTEYIHENNERVLILINDDLIDDTYRQYWDKLFNDIHIKLSKEIDCIHEIHRLISKLESEDTKHLEYNKDMKKLCINQLLVLFQRYQVHNSDDKRPASYHIIQETITYINNNLDSDLSLNVLAERYNLSTAHFSRLFKKTLGITLIEYINIAKVSAAKEQLETNYKSITDVALSCGFNDSNYFYRVFKKVIGMTPKEYADNFSSLSKDSKHNA